MALPALLPGASLAYQLEDIGLTSDASQTSLRIAFSKGAGGEGDYPLYFQKADPDRGTLTLSFLDTETSFPLGRHGVDQANPLVEEILLKRVTSPSGKAFLGIEIRLKEPPAGEAPVQPQPKGSLKVLLGKGTTGSGGRPGKRVTWSLAKALKSGGENPGAKAEAPPAGSLSRGKQSAPKGDASAEPGSRALEAAESASPSEGSSESTSPVQLKEIRLAVTRAQEDLSLVLDPPGSTPVHTAQTDPTDSTVLELTLDGVTSGLARKEFILPGSGLFRKVWVESRGGNLVLRFQLASRDPVHILPREGGLILTGAGKGEAAVASKWTSAKPDAAPPQVADGAPDPVMSAHEEGAAVDAGTGGKSGSGKGLSSSKIFSLGKGGKSMILLKDSAALKAEPAPKAKSKSKLPLGAKVERIGREGAWIRVATNGDTGFIRAQDAAYADELTAAQAAALDKGLAAIAARVEAQRQAEAKAAEEKAAAEARQATAATAASAEAEPVRVAGPAVAAPAPLSERPKAAAAAAGGLKLSLAENAELADKAAQDKKAEEEKRLELAASRVAYNSYGRRDPFIPVEQGIADNGIDIDQMKVVGIIWQAQEPMAVLEHNKESGVSFTVKQGDPVHNGRVSRITRDQVTFDISEYGISRSYSLKLVSNKEGKKQ